MISNPRARWSPRLGLVYEAFLTGIPFGVFKTGAGWMLLAFSPVLGFPVILWGLLDIVLNLLTVVAPQRFSWCLMSNLGRSVGGPWEERLLALDTLMAFLIVAVSIGFGLSGHLPPPLARTWELAVIGNVLGVGVARVYRAWST